MAKTKTITFSCDNAHIAPNGHKQVELEVSAPDIDNLLAEVDDDDLTVFCGRNYQPEDIFSESVLEKWAEANGYVKADNNE